MAATASSKHLKISRSYVLYGLLCTVGLYVLLPQLGLFHDSWRTAKGAQPAYMIAAVVATSMTYMAAAGVYFFLAVKPLHYSRTLRLQLASMFVNRLLPAGIGNLGVNYLYLRKSRHSAAQATSVVVANNSVGFVGHLLLLGILLAALPLRLPVAHLHIDKKSLLSAAVATLILTAILALIPKSRRRLRRTSILAVQQLANYRQRPTRLLMALLCSLLLTLSNVLCLWFSVLAVHISIGLLPILLVFTLGIALGTATPTPGGLGGLEAAMVGGLISYHVPSSAALAAVLLYRLVSYWLALLVGLRMFVLARQREYF